MAELKSNRVVFTQFLLLIIVAIISLNLNGFVFLYTGKTAILSPIILMLAVIIFFLNLDDYDRVNCDTVISNLFLKFLLFYAIYGSIVAFILTRSSFNILEGLRNTIPTILLFFVLYNNFCEFYMKKPNLIINILTFFYIISVASIMLFDNLGFYEIGNYDGYEINNRKSGVFANANDAGSACNYLFVFVLYQLKVNKNKVLRFLLVILVPLIFMSLLASFSRSSIIVFIVLLCYFYISDFFVKEKGKYFIKNSLILIASVMIIGSVIYNYFDIYLDSLEPSQRLRIESLVLVFDGNANKVLTNEDLNGNRIELSILYWDYVFNNPIIGYGINAFHGKSELNELGSHNSYLMIWGESGIVGISMFVFLIILIYRKANQLKDYNLSFLVKGLLIALTSFFYTSHNLIKDRSALLILTLICFILLDKRNKDFMSNENK